MNSELPTDDQNPGDQNPSEWTRLFSEFVDGAPSEADKKRLADLLQNNAACLEQWYRFHDTELGLAEWAAKTVAAVGCKTPQPDLTPAPKKRWPSALVRWQAVSGGLAASLLIMAAFAGWQAFVTPEALPPEALPTVARVLELKNERWVNPESALHVGDRLSSGQRVEISAGQARIEFDSGAVVTLIGPAIFEPTSTNSAYLLIGQMRAKAETPQSTGFAVRTRTACFVDIGTEFGATASTDGHSRIDVLTGAVDVHFKGVDLPQHLQIGDAMSVEPGAPLIIARVETGDDTPAFRFPTIEPPTDRDYADQAFGRATIQCVGGKFYKSSGPTKVLLNGKGQSIADAPGESVFFESDEPGYLQVDLGKTVAVQKINTYSWHCNKLDPDDRSRAVQKFFLYGFAGDEPPATTGSLTDNGWVLLARVNTDENLGVFLPQLRPAQQASSVTAARGDIGRYRYLLWKVLPSQNLYRPRLDNTFYGEIDVYAKP